MYSVAAGSGASAIGICCVSVGDNVHTQGAFQVSFEKKLNLDGFGNDPEKIDNTIKEVTRFKSLYQSFTEQGFAPSDFSSRANPALDFLVSELINRKNALLMNKPSSVEEVE